MGAVQNRCAACPDFPGARGGGGQPIRDTATTRSGSLVAAGHLVRALLDAVSSYAAAADDCAWLDNPGCDLAGVWKLHGGTAAANVADYGAASLPALV